MTIEYAIDGTPLPASAVLINPEGGQGFPTSAWYCDPMVGDFQIDDPNGDYELEGWHVLTVDDDADADRARIFTGWLVGFAHSRGPYGSGPSRVWEVQVIDQNAALQLEIFRSTAASVRPAETDVERVLSAITSHAQAGTPVVDNGRVATDHPLNIDASNFVEQRPSDMIVGAAGQTNNNAYAYWDHANAEIALHYDTVGEGPAAQISVSNVPGVYDEIDVFPPFVDARKETETDGLRTGVLVKWTGGNTYARNLDLIDSLSPSPLSPENFLRDVVVDSFRIGRASTAATYTDTQLAIHSVPKHTLRFTLRLPAAKHNAIQSGDVVNVQFSHIVGYESSTPVVVIKSVKRPTDGSVDLYDIDYECADFGTAVGAGGGGTGGLPSSPPCSEGAIALVNEYHGTEASGVTNVTIPITTPPTAGNLLVFHTTMREGPSDADPIAGWTLSPLGATDTPQPTGAHDKSSHAWYYRIADGTETDVSSNWTPNDDEIRGYVAEWAGVGATIVDSAIDDGSDTGDCHCGEVTPGAGQVVLILSAVIYNDGGDSWPYPDPVWSDGASELEFNIGGGENHPAQCIGYQVTTGTGAGISHLLTVDIAPNGDESYAAQTLVFLCSSAGEDMPPPPLKPVVGETPGGTVDGSNDDFTTGNPFADETLRILCNGIDVTAQVTASDGAAGTFTLDFAPWPTDVLTTYYLVHP